MALDFYLEIANGAPELGSGWILQQAARLGGLESSVHDSPVTGPGIAVCASVDPEEPSRFGLAAPDLVLCFRLGKHEDHQRGHAAMLRIVTGLARGLRRRMVLSFADGNERVSYE